MWNKRLVVKLCVFFSAFAGACQNQKDEAGSTPLTIVREGSGNRIKSYWKQGPMVNDMESYACFYFGSEGKMSNARTLFPRFTNWSQLDDAVRKELMRLANITDGILTLWLKTEKELNSCTENCQIVRQLYAHLEQKHSAAKVKLGEASKLREARHQATLNEFVLEGSTDDRTVLSPRAFDFMVESLSRVGTPSAVLEQCPSASQIF